MPDMVDRRLNESHPRIGAPSLSSLYMRRLGPRESQPLNVEPHAWHGGFCTTGHASVMNNYFGSFRTFAHRASIFCGFGKLL